MEIRKRVLFQWAAFTATARTGPVKGPSAQGLLAQQNQNKGMLSSLPCRWLAGRFLPVVSGEAVHEHRGDTRQRSWGVGWMRAHREGLAIAMESTVRRKST
jgi:hypothetical protein